LPRTEVFFYQDEDDRAPVVAWLKTLRREDRKAYAKCVARIRRLAEAGHELRRPEADYRRDGLYELRARHGRVNDRIPYFFHGQQVALLTHGLTKEGEIPPGDIERAKRRKDAFEHDPEQHTYEEEANDG
jgi:phage-related protein